MKFFMHLLVAVKIVSGLVSLAAVATLYVGTVIWLFEWLQWWSISLGTVMIVLAISLPIAVVNYIEEKETEELRKRLEEVWSK